jgi:hypothetical protein
MALMPRARSAEVRDSNHQRSTALVLGAEREISGLQIRKIAQHDQGMRRSPQESQRVSEGSHVPWAGDTWTRLAGSPMAPAKSSKKPSFRPLSVGDLCRNASWREICAEWIAIFNFARRLEVEVRISRSGTPRFLPWCASGALLGIGTN